MLFHTNIFSDISLPLNSRSAVLNFYCNKYFVLPNIRDNWPLSCPQTRLIAAYNRYLNQRLLNYNKLKLDLIREKRYKCILSSHTPSSFSASTLSLSLASNSQTATELLDQTQCALMQTRLILDCIFTPELLNDPIYNACYNLLAIDISSLFNFLNHALVYSLQNFFGLMRSDAERTLFIYKEFTQLQVTEEVLNFVDLAPNMSNPHDLDIPQALRQDQQGVINLTRALESYLYENQAPRATDDIPNSMPSTPTSPRSNRLSSPATSVGRTDSREVLAFHFKKDLAKDPSGWNDIFDFFIGSEAPQLTLSDPLPSLPPTPITPSICSGLYIPQTSLYTTGPASKTASYATSISTTTTGSFFGSATLLPSSASIRSKFRGKKNVFLFKGLRRND